MTKSALAEKIYNALEAEMYRLKDSGNLKAAEAIMDYISSASDDSLIFLASIIKGV